MSCTENILCPENQEVSVSRIGEDLVAILSSIRSQGESNWQARFGITFHPLLAAESCNWHYFASLCLDSHVRYMTISMKTHRDHSLLWESKNLSRAVSSAEILLLSTSTIHLVLRLRTRPTLVSYFNRFPTSFSFFSSSLNHSLSMYSVHFLPNPELDKSRIVEIWDASITILGGGTHRCI